jgi:two-component system, NarL family, nitrate/nitrite response regulator NarL
MLRWYEEFKVRVLIADDHDLVREILAAYLMREPGFEVETAADFKSAAKKIKSDSKFDLVLLDYNMPGMNGIQGVTEAIALNGGRPVAVISGTAAKLIAQKILLAGAIGFLPKSISARSLIHAIRFMASGEKYAPIDFMGSEEVLEKNALEASLTKREAEVLKGLTKGLSNKEIGRDISIQEVTVKLHLKTLCRKINARNRTHAAVIAVEAGLH